MLTDDPFCGRCAMTRARTGLVLSTLLLLAAITLPSAVNGQATTEAKRKNVWCGGSVLGGIANSGSKFTVKVFAFISPDIYGMGDHHQPPVGAAKVLLFTGRKMEHEISAVTNAGGVAEFSDVPSGEYTVRIEGERFME
jgi:hypothetical protein